MLQVSATFVSEDDTVRALEGGADACLTEPIEAAKLVSAVASLAERPRSNAGDATAS